MHKAIQGRNIGLKLGSQGHKSTRVDGPALHLVVNHGDEYDSYSVVFVVCERIATANSFTAPTLLVHSSKVHAAKLNGTWRNLDMQQSWVFLCVFDHKVVKEVNVQAAKSI